MIIKKAFYFENIIRPIQFTRPILDNNGNNVKGLLISDDCKLYNKEEYNSYQYYKYIPESDKINIRMVNRGFYNDNRLYVNGLNVEYQNLSKTTSMPRVLLIAFDNDDHDKLNYYKQFQVNHINPSRPLTNTLENLEWVTPEENMRKAGETGCMVKKYNKELIYNICKDIVNGVGRQELMKKYNVNYQLIDDIRAGRSHKSVSKQFIKDGFKYNPGNKIESKRKAKLVCELLEQGYRKSDIVEKLKNENINYQFVTSIKSHVCHNDISKDYNF